MASTDFALAQERIAARRRAREAEQVAQLAAQQENSEVRQRLARLPYPLAGLGRAGITTWENIRGREGTRPAFRVGQVDAELLDEELLELLKGQVGEALKYFGSHIQDEWSAEIMLALRAVLFKLSVWDHGISIDNLFSTRRVLIKV
jgi:peroxin-2